MFDFRTATQLWAVGAVLRLKTPNGTVVKEIPTFYLNPNVQGITDHRGAERIAREIINPTDNPDIAASLSIAVALCSAPVT